MASSSGLDEQSSNDPLLEGKITVYVGSPLKAFYVTRKHFVQIIPMKPAIAAGIISYKLRDVSPEGLTLITAWLETGDFLEWHQDRIRDGKQMFSYLDLYAQAEEWDNPKLKFAILDAIKSIKSDDQRGSVKSFANKVFQVSKLFVNKVYQITKPQAGLRRLIIDSFLYQTQMHQAAWTQRRRAFLDVHSMCGNKDFVIDVYEAIVNRLQKPNDHDVNPYDRENCYYHDHPNGEKCTPGLKGKAPVADLGQSHRPSLAGVSTNASSGKGKSLAKNMDGNEVNDAASSSTQAPKRKRTKRARDDGGKEADAAKAKKSKRIKLQFGTPPTAGCKA